MNTERLYAHLDEVSWNFNVRIIIYFFIVFKLLINNLYYSVYRSDDGSLYFLPVVKKAEQMVVKETENHNYLPTFGVHDFTKVACTLLLGDIEKQWNDGMVTILIFFVHCNIMY